MDDEQLKKRLRQALAARQTGRTPAFETTLAAATERHRHAVRCYAYAAGAAAAAAMVAVTLGLWSSLPGRSAPEYLSEQALLGSTAWTAPSDVLLPEYEFDLYRDLPVLIEPTQLQDGALL